MTPSDFRLEIQGLRAVAVLAVMAFHYDSVLLRGGFGGVDVFFVISGFIISNLILNSPKKFSWGSFYWGRIKRILPAYFVMLSVVTLIASVLFILTDFSLFFESLKSSARFGSNYYFSNAGNYFAPSATEWPLLHTWSLAVEMQFYLLLPLLLVWAPRRTLKMVLPVFIVLGFGLVFYQAQAQGSSNKLYFSLLARIPEFLIGAYLAASGAGGNLGRQSRTVVGWLGVAIVGIAFVLGDKSNFFNGMIIFPCIGTALVIISRGEGMGWLSSRLMVWIGSASFSLYLWHWPVLSFLRYLTQTYELNLWWSFVFIIVTMTVSLTSVEFIEKPCRKLSFDWKLIHARSLLRVSVLMSPFLAATYVNANAFKAPDVQSTRYADAATICHGQIVGNCIRGDSSVPPLALVLGDSHAAQLNIFFDTFGAAKHQSFKVITASSCVTIKNFDVERIPEWARHDCTEQISFANQILPSFKILIVAAMWSYQMESPAFTKAFDTFLQETAKSGQRIIVLGQIPELEGNALRTERINAMGLTFKNRKTEFAKKANLKVARLLSTYNHATFLDFYSSDIFTAAPFYHNHLIYMDAHHLNEVGAAVYGNTVAPELSQLLHPL